MEVIQTEEAPAAVGAYSQGHRANDLIITSGQVGLSPEAGTLQDESFTSEARQALNNVISIVRAGGGNRDTILKTTVYLTDLDFYSSLNDLYSELFTDPLPARSVVEVSDLPANATVEIEALAEVQ